MLIICDCCSFFKKSRRTLPEPETPEPPKITNFAAIPMCTYKRRHIRIDTDQLYDLVCGIQAQPLKFGKLIDKKTGRPKFINVTPDEFLINPVESWGLYFDMGKINRQVKYKKRFGKQIVTDGVSASVLYHQPKQEKAPIDDEQVKRKLVAGEIPIELSIDPGMRTWNAAVRYNFITHEEVIVDKMICAFMS